MEREFGFGMVEVVVVGDVRVGVWVVDGEGGVGSASGCAGRELQQPCRCGEREVVS